jgi:hypothetical protein
MIHKVRAIILYNQRTSLSRVRYSKVPSRTMGKTSYAERNFIANQSIAPP